MIDLRHGECLGLMKDIPKGSIDMVLTSPPYSLGKNYDETVDLEAFIKQSAEKLKPSAVFVWQVGSTMIDGFLEPLDIMYHHVFKSLGFKLLNRVVWTFGHGLHCKKRLSGRYETICIYVKNKDYIFNLDDIRVPQKYPNKKHYRGPNKGKLSGNPLGKNPGDVWTIGNVKHNHPEKTGHPCQFPESLCEKIISGFTNRESVVMDPFMGSGTVGVVCKNLGRNFIGIEMDNRYFEIAKERIL